MPFLFIDYDYDYSSLSITIMITLYFFDYDYDYDYINHISWLQSRLRVIKIILEILTTNNDIL